MKLTTFERATTAAGFDVDRCGTELTYTPSIAWTSTIGEAVKEQDWFIDAPLDEGVIYSARINDRDPVRLIQSPSGTKEWINLQSTATCGLLVPVHAGDTVELVVSADVPLGKSKKVRTQVLLDGSFECPKHHSVMSSPGYTIMDTDTSQLMCYLSIADVNGTISIVSVTVHARLDEKIW